MPERATGVKAYNESIFFNCPFDDAYKPIFEALVFAAFDCGYVPRCALEADDAEDDLFGCILKFDARQNLALHLAGIVDHDGRYPADIDLAVMGLADGEQHAAVALDAFDHADAPIAEGAGIGAGA